MGLKGLAKKLVGGAVAPYGFEILDRSVLYEWQYEQPPGGRQEAAQLPPGAAEYLTAGNPRLVDLRERYARCSPAVTTPLVWTDDHVAGDRLRFFRGDYAYVWQLSGTNMNVLGYALTTYYVKSIDTLGLLDKLTDDNMFGNHTFPIGGRPMSRDLLDSIIEIYFLERHLKLSSLPGVTILDVGAGYGRLAHRMVHSLGNIKEYVCADAVPVSTLICDYYLKFRACEARAAVLPLDELESRLAERQIDLAINIHSFSECRTSAIDWWLSLLARHRVRYLMIVPNTPRKTVGETLLTNDGHDFGGIVTKHGYSLVAREPKYRDPIVQQYAINPTHHYLFELR
jgi:hypothetical protein